MTAWQKHFSKVSATTAIIKIQTKSWPTAIDKNV